VRAFKRRTHFNLQSLSNVFLVELQKEIICKLCQDSYFYDSPHDLQSMLSENFSNHLTLVALDFLFAEKKLDIVLGNLRLCSAPSQTLAQLDYKIISILSNFWSLCWESSTIYSDL